MKPKFLTLFSGDISLPSCSFAGEFHFWHVKLQISQSGDHLCVTFSVEKGEELGSLVILTETKITIGKDEFFIDKDLWSKTEELWSTGVPVCSGEVKLEVRMVDILPTVPITQPSKLRKMQVLCFNSVYYVDIDRLSEIGGYLFQEWRKRKDEGHSRVVASNMDDEDLRILLEAVVKHDFIVVYRRNYLRLCETGEKFRILPLLRAVEQYLMDAHIHPMRRLEFSVEMRMARLYDFAMREMGPPHIALRKLHQYLEANGETMNDVHPKLLAALNITPEYMIIRRLTRLAIQPIQFKNGFLAYSTVETEPTTKKKLVDDVAQDLLSKPSSKIPRKLSRLAAALKIKTTKDKMDPTLRTLLDNASARLYYNCADNYNYTQLCESFGLPDYMSSWFKLTLLHTWMVLMRIHISLDAEAYLRLQRGILASMWMDVDKRLEIVGNELNEILTSKSDVGHMHGLHIQTFLEYDEGFLSDDRTLAAAVWRCLYMERECDPINLLKVVTYMRSTMAWLDTLDLNDILVDGIKEWKQIKPRQL